MKQRFILPAIILIALFSAFTFYRHQPVPGKDNGETPPENVNNKKQPKIQIVFALDATGSMSGLIGAAKEKIWSIAGSLSQATPAPVIEMGLIFYRDRGDDFVTKRIPLSKDIDSVYEQLMRINAAGGGDTPESVNQALHEAVIQFNWDTSTTVYKTVFLVGDCPPHMDYQQDIKYPVSCQLAKQKDIVLNTILMGNDRQAKLVWTDIAKCNQGSFTQVNMNANDIEINTPYDSAIAVIADQLDDTRIYYGNAAEKSASLGKLSKSKQITGSAKVNVKAQRAEYNASDAGKGAYYGNKELLENYKEGSVELESIKPEELPDEMKNMNAAQKKKFVEQRIAHRDSLNTVLIRLTKQRQAYIESDLKKRSPEEVEGSFNNQIYKSIRIQTEKKNIHLDEKTKY
ncbi:MAG: VWA domain-containing protein [Chitinophagaceae bacterium]|nr:VWA domain-containing protein [Chitinophagaceae bacterium]